MEEAGIRQYSETLSRLFGQRADQSNQFVTAFVDVSAPPPYTFPVSEASLQGCSCCLRYQDAPLRAPFLSDLTSVAASALPPYTFPVAEALLQGCSCCPVYQDASLRASSLSDLMSVAASPLPPYNFLVARALLQ